MSNEDQADTLRNHMDKVIDLNKKADRLSKYVALVEELMSTSPIRVRVEAIDRSGNNLSFERATGNQWALVFSTLHEEGAEGEYVTQASLSVKARSAVLIPSLLEVWRETQIERAEEIHAGLDALNSIPWLKNLLDKKEEESQELPF